MLVGVLERAFERGGRVGGTESSDEIVGSIHGFVFGTPRMMKQESLAISKAL